MSRIMVTGGAGFIGSHLVRSLLDLGHDVLNVDAYTYSAVPAALSNLKTDRYQLVTTRVESKHEIGSLIMDYSPQVLFHLAAETHVDRSIAEPDTFLVTNVLGTASILSGSLQHYRRLSGEDARRFKVIHVSTDEVYGSSAGQPFTASTRYDPRSPYSASKAASDHLARAWFHTYGLPTIVTNCSNNYGPWQYPDKLVPRMITRALTGRSMQLYGDGLHERDWLHVRDHVAGLHLAMRDGIPGSTYLFGTGVAITNRTLVETLGRCLDDELDVASGTHAQLIEFVEDRPGHDRRYVIDARATTKELGWEPSTDVQSGISWTVRWYIENRRWWHEILEKRYDTERLGRL